MKLTIPNGVRWSIPRPKSTSYSADNIIYTSLSIISEQLPGYIRRFAPDYVRARILSSLTEVLQRARRYEQAIELLQYLLGTITASFSREKLTSSSFV